MIGNALRKDWMDCATYSNVFNSIYVFSSPLVRKSILCNKHWSIIVGSLDPVEQFTEPPWHHLYQKTSILVQWAHNITDKS
jgi:hypothetical protein